MPLMKMRIILMTLRGKSRSMLDEDISSICLVNFNLW